MTIETKSRDRSDRIKSTLISVDDLKSKMTEAHTNPAFVPDYNGSFSPLDEYKENGKDLKALHIVDMKNEKKAIEADGDYEPYRHRKVDHPTSNTDTLFHLLKGSLGTGILAMPNAFYHSGYILGLVGTLIIGLICTYSIHILIKAEYELCRRKKVPSLTYPATAEAAFAEGPVALRKFSRYSGHVVNGFLLVYQLGTCCVYIVFIASNIKSVVDEYSPDLDIKIYMLIFLVPLIFLNYIKNLKFLAPFSTAANAVTLISFGFILYYMIIQVPTLEHREPIGKLSHIPLFFGTVLFALEAIGVILPLENEMKTPKSFGGSCGVLNLAMCVIVSLYVGMGLLGYMTYGSDAEGSITLNIPSDEIPAQVIKVMYALAIFVTYGLQCYVAVDIAWNMYLAPVLDKSKRKTFWEYVTRTVLVLITFLLAVAVPKLDLFISLFGALCLSALGISIPAIIDMSTYWYVYKGAKFALILTKNALLVVFGVTGLIIGTYTSLHDIIKEFS